MLRGRTRGWGWKRWAALAVAAQAALMLVAFAPKVKIGSEDTDLYHRYASRTLAGEVPYRDFLVEYPPLAMPLFLLPRLAAPGVLGFKVAFALEMLLLNSAAVALAARYVDSRLGPDAVPARLAWYSLAFLPLARLVATRYDAAPMLLAFAAAVGWSSGRPMLGGALAALGGLAKVAPGVVAAVFAPWDIRAARGRGLIAFALAGLVGLGAWVAVGGAGGVGRSLGYHRERGFEYGSTYSGVQMLAAKLAGAEIAIERTHASFATVTPWTATLLMLVAPIQAAALAAATAIAARRGTAEGVRLAGAALLGFILAGKVFSPQFLIWLIPFVAVLEGPISRRCRLLFLAGVVATLLAQASVGPFGRTGLGPILAYNARNALLAWLWGLLVFGPPADLPGSGRGSR